MARYGSCVIFKRTNNTVIKSNNLYAYILYKLQINRFKIAWTIPTFRSFVLYIFLIQHCLTNIRNLPLANFSELAMVFGKKMNKKSCMLIYLKFCQQNNNKLKMGKTEKANYYVVFMDDCNIMWIILKILY